MNGKSGERATLDFGDIEETPASQSPPPVDLEAVKETAAKAGFRETTSTTKIKKAPEAPQRPRRLKRRRTGRIHQFATRLNEPTLNAIYDIAEQEGITLAEVIERALAALAKQYQREQRS
jgi:hypothetical protein